MYSPDKVTPSPLTPHPSLLAPHTSPLAHSSLLTPHTYLTPHPTLPPHPSLLALHSSPLTPHSSLLTPHLPHSHSSEEGDRCPEAGICAGWSAGAVPGLGLHGEEVHPARRVTECEGGEGGEGWREGEREEGSLVSRRNTQRIPSGDYGQYSVDVAGMLAPPIRLQYSHNYYV